MSERLGDDNQTTWRDAALRVGEELSSVGPYGYYILPAAEWRDWALKSLRESSARARGLREALAELNEAAEDYRIYSELSRVQDTPKVIRLLHARNAARELLAAAPEAEGATPEEGKGR